MHRKRGLRPCQGCWGIAVTGIACMSNTVIPGISRIRPSIGDSAFTLFPVRSDCPLARYTTRPGVRSGISGGGVRICNPQQVAWNRWKLKRERRCKNIDVSLRYSDVVMKNWLLWSLNYPCIFILILLEIWCKNIYIMEYFIFLYTGIVAVSESRKLVVASLL